MLGLVCHYVDANGNNTTGNRSLQLGKYKSGKYSEQDIRQVYIDNIASLERTLVRVAEAGIGLFRMTSDLFPLASEVPREWWHNIENARSLKNIGDYVHAMNMRVTFHPGQFCVIGSTRHDVVKNAITDLDIHATCMDMMGLDESPKWAINIHAGSRDAMSRLVDSLRKLRPGIRKRLTLENCESVASVAELLPISQASGIPIVFDSHHHVFRNGNLKMGQAMIAAMHTWPAGIIPLQHISNTTPGLENGTFTERRKHADYIHTIPVDQLHALIANEIDVEVEAKMKNLAIVQMSEKFFIPLWSKR